MNENQKLIWACDILKRAMRDNLYGHVTFKFENGNLTLAKTEKSEKPNVVDL